MRVPQPIPYQGSKRNIARIILSFFPREFNTLIEPFAGSAAVSLAAAAYGKAHRFHLNDINKPLMELWRKIISSPKEIADAYERLWNEQRGREKKFYFYIRDQFNKTHRPDYLLFLLARCVKASIRYNSNGEFNQSPDNRRKGRHPQKMREAIFIASNLLKGRTIVTSKDYKEILDGVKKEDLVYMDPPYQGVCTGRDPRYYMGIDFDEFVEQLDKLNRKWIAFILSYDGRKEEKKYVNELPQELELFKVEICTGPSAQSTLLGKSEYTYESLYLSKELLNKLEEPIDIIVKRFTPHKTVQLKIPVGDK